MTRRSQAKDLVYRTKTGKCWYTLHECAERAGVCYETMWRLARQGAFPEGVITRIGHMYRVNAYKFDKILERGGINPGHIPRPEKEKQEETE